MGVRTLFTYGDDGAGNPLVVGTYTTDSQERMTEVRVVNNDALAVLVEIVRTADAGDPPGRIYSQRFPPGETFITLPTNLQNRIKVLIDTSGEVPKIRGFEKHVFVGYP